MVDVVQWNPTQIRRWADNWIPRLATYWEKLPEVMAEIDSWNDDDAMDYIEEWRHYESQRYNLERVAVMDALTVEQQARLCQLRELVDEHRPLLDRLLGI